MKITTIVLLLLLLWQWALHSRHKSKTKDYKNEFKK